MSEFEPVLSYYEQEQRRNQEAVFGKSRIEATKGHEATPEDIQKLVNAVRALCEEEHLDVDSLPVPDLYLHDIVGGEPSADFYNKAPKTRHSEKTARRIDREGLPPIWLVSNPKRESSGPLDWDHYDHFVARLEDITIEKKTYLRPRWPMLPGKYEVHESLFLDPELGRADLVRYFSPLYKAGRFISSTKQATAVELNEALRVLASAVQREDERLENVR